MGSIQYRISVYDLYLRDQAQLQHQCTDFFQRGQIRWQDQCTRFILVRTISSMESVYSIYSCDVLSDWDQARLQNQCTWIIPGCIFRVQNQWSRLVLAISIPITESMYLIYCREVNPDYRMNVVDLFSRGQSSKEKCHFFKMCSLTGPHQGIVEIGKTHKTVYAVYMANNMKQVTWM